MHTSIYISAADERDVKRKRKNGPGANLEPHAQQRKGEYISPTNKRDKIARQYIYIDGQSPPRAPLFYIRVTRGAKIIIRAAYRTGRSPLSAKLRHRPNERPLVIYTCEGKGGIARLFYIMRPARVARLARSFIIRYRFRSFLATVGVYMYKPVNGIRLISRRALIRYYGHPRCCEYNVTCRRMCLSARACGLIYIELNVTCRLIRGYLRWGTLKWCFVNC